MLSCVTSSSRLVRRSLQNCPKSRLKSLSSTPSSSASSASVLSLGSCSWPQYSSIRSLLRFTGIRSSVQSHSIQKSGISRFGTRFASSSSSDSVTQARSGALTTSKRLLELWNEWEKEQDPFAKRTWGKMLIDLYAALSKQLSSLAKDEAEFEHLATLHGHPVAQNCYRLGAVHAQRFEWEPAVESLQRCVDLDPGNYTHYMKFGEVLHAARMYGSAVQVYSTVLTTMSSEFQKSSDKPKQVDRPESFDSTIFKGLTFTPRMQYPYSKLAEVLYRRAHSHLVQHDWDSALADWKSVIGLEPNHRTAESWAYLAHLSRILGKWQQTVDLSTKALEFDSELLIALYERSLAHFVLKNEENVKADNRKYAVLAHERIWGLSNHPIQPDWGPDRDDSDHDL